MIKLAEEKNEEITEGNHEEATKIDNQNSHAKDQEKQQIPYVSLAVMLGITQYHTQNVKREGQNCGDHH